MYYNITITMLSACKFNDMEYVNVLIKKGVRGNDNYSFTPLHYACINGNTDLVNILLELGYNNNNNGISYKFCFNFGDGEFGYTVTNATPLFIAIINNNEQITKSLIKYNTDIYESFNIVDEKFVISKYTLIDIAIINKNNYIIVLLLTNKNFARLNTQHQKYVIDMLNDNPNLLNMMNCNRFIQALNDSTYESCKKNKLLCKILFKCTSYQNMDSDLRLYVEYLIQKEITTNIYFSEHGLHKLIFSYVDI